MPMPKSYMHPCDYKPQFECEEEIDDECPNHPDLLLLRDAAADERNAIAFYLQAAMDGCLPELFLDIAEDEMQHFVATMRLVSQLDPVQAEMFQEEGLDILTIMRRTTARKRHTKAHVKPGQTQYMGQHTMGNQKWNAKQMVQEMKVMEAMEAMEAIEEADVMVIPPEPNEMPLVLRLTKALEDELQAINKYQRYMDEACEPEVREHFCYLMNEEKEHVAEVTAALFAVTNEPLPEE